MQYPQIQFYRGSLVRLASGKLKQVEDLDSDDFLESARLIGSTNGATTNNNNCINSTQGNTTLKRHDQRPGSLDENNNSVFNSPEPTPNFDSPTMEIEEEDDDDELVDVVSPAEHTPLNLHHNPHLHNNHHNHHHHLQHHHHPFVHQQPQQHNQRQQQQLPEAEDFYVDSSVVRDFLEVGPPSSASPTSSASSPPAANPDLPLSSFPSTSSSSASTPPANGSPNAVNLTVLIKFFLESTRSVAFIEVPIEHPFFVFHRGWSSWNPQRTYDKFGLKCRKLKIGDTCISLIRRQRKQTHQQQQESDHCNLLFSSIKINE